MKTRSAVLMLLTLVLAPAAAQAKGPDTARICGTSSCVTVTNVEQVNELALLDGFSTRSAPEPARFYTVELTSSRAKDVRWSFLYVPSQRAIRVNRANFGASIYAEQAPQPYWVTPRASALSAFANATRALEPQAASAEWRPDAESGSGVWKVVVGGLAAVLVAAGAIVLVKVFKRRPLHPHLGQYES